MHIIRLSGRRTYQLEPPAAPVLEPVERRHSAFRRQWYFLDPPAVETVDLASHRHSPFRRQWYFLDQPIPAGTQPHVYRHRLDRRSLYHLDPSDDVVVEIPWGPGGPTDGIRVRMAGHLVPRDVQDLFDILSIIVLLLAEADDDA